MNYNIIIGLILISLVVLKINNKLDISFTVLNIIIGITILLMLTNNNTTEFMTDTEVLQNIGSIFDTTNMKVTNLKVTGDVTINGKLTAPEATIKKLQSDTTYLGSSTTAGILNTSDGKLIINGKVDIPEATINKLKTDNINLGLTSAGGTIDGGSNKLKIIGNDITMDNVKMNNLTANKIDVGLTNKGGIITGNSGRLIIDSDVKVTGLMGVNMNRKNAVNTEYFRVNEGDGGKSHMYYSKGRDISSNSNDRESFPW